MENVFVLLVQLVSTVAAAVAAVMAYKTVVVAQDTHRSGQHAELEKLLMAMDIEAIHNPGLLRVYDKVEFEDGDDKEEKKWRMQAQLYYFFNLFQLAYNVCHDKYDRVKPSDEECWEMWNKFITDFMNKSSSAQQLIRDPEFVAFYMKNFGRYIKTKLPNEVHLEHSKQSLV